MYVNVLGFVLVGCVLIRLLRLQVVTFSEVHAVATNELHLHKDTDT